MDDMEKVFADGLRKAASGRPALPIDVEEVIARGEAAGRAPVGRRSWRWLAAAAAVLLVAGIGAGAWYLNRPGAVPAVPMGSPSAAPVVLTGTRWLATEIEGRPVEESASTARRESVPWLEFDATTVSGGDPCNGVGADYRLDGDRLSFSNWGATTAMGCHSAQQQRFTKALRDTTRLQRDGDELEFLDDAGTVVLRLSAAPEAAPTPTNPATGVASAYRLRVYNGTGVALDHVRVQPRTGDEVNIGTLKAGGTSELVAVPWVDDQAVVTASAGDVRYSFTQDSYRGEAEWMPGDYAYILRLGGDGTTFFEFSGWARATTGPGVVQVRVRNDSSHDFTGVVVVFPDGTRTGFGDLAAGAAADFVDVADPVYSYAYAEAKVAGKKLVLQPVDYVGEKALDPGAYTYALSLDDEGGLSLSLEKDG